MILIKNATAVHFMPESQVSDLDIRIEGNRITETGSSLKPAPGETVIDASGKIVMPGLVVAHHHFYSGLARGITAHIGPTPDFASTLKNLWWRMDRALDADSLYSSALICCIDALRCGATAVIDHHASPEFIDGSLGVIKKAFEITGLRGATCYETTDRNGQAGAEEGIAENIRFAQELDAEKKAGTWSGLVECHIGGHAPFTLGDSTLKALGDAVAATGRGFHTHIAEDRYDPSHSHAEHGIDPAKRLDSYGLITGKSLLVHGLYLNDDEIALINERGAFLVHNARSNMNNGVGYARWIGRIENAALGTDGIGGDMFEEFKFAYFSHRNSGGGLWPGDYLKMLANGNRIIGPLFGMDFGRIEDGCAADLIICGYDAPTPLSAENIAGHMAFGMQSKNVETVIVGGNIVIENGSLTKGLSGIYADARKEAAALWKRMDTIAP